MSAIQAVTSENFSEVVLQAEQPVLVDFGAEWCAPCRMMTPIVEAIAGDYAGKMRVLTLDVDTNPDIMTAYEVMGLPTLILYRGGEVAARVSGYRPKEMILRALASYL